MANMSALMLQHRSELAGVEIFALQHSFEDLETLLNSVEVSAVVTLLGTELLDIAPVQHVLHSQFKLFFVAGSYT